MRDHALYERLLGIGRPWRVWDVQLKLDAGEVVIQLEVDETAIAVCPTCGKPVPGYDKRERQWRHLDTMQYRTLLVAQVPRVNCDVHGVQLIGVPWAERNARFTALFESLVIDWSLATSLVAASRLLHLSWDQVSGVQARAVARGLARRELAPVTRIGVDETSFQKRHEYVTVVCDLDATQGGVLYVADDRKESSLAPFFEQLGSQGCQQLQHVAMDMWPAYINATTKALDDADEKIVFDKFHIAKHLGDAVDQVRRDEHRRLHQQGDERLTHTKYDWLRNTRAMNQQERREFAELRRSGLQVARAWAIRQMAMSLWGYVSRGWAQRAWKRWYGWAIRSRLEPICKVARMIKRHWDGVMNAVTSNTTNAKAESLNAKIQWIKHKACGYRNRDRFRTAIYFHLGGLDLYPANLRVTHTNS